MAIKAHTLLHHDLRHADDGIIHADIPNDYATVSELTADLLAETSDLKISERVLETVEAVKKLQPAKGREIGGYLGLDTSVALRRLQRAVEAGLVINLQARRHRPGQYRAADITLANLDLLPTPQKLERAWRE
jgi:hypothetical protein